MNNKRKYIPYDHSLVEKVRENRKNPTPAEKKMWYEILSRKSFHRLKFTKQKPLDQYIADFYCAELKLVIEIDGDSHAEQLEYDRKRTERLEKYGIHVMRYSNHDVMNNIEGVHQDLEKQVFKLKKGKKSPADFVGSPLTGG